MTTLTLELAPTVYQRLHEEADRLGKPAQVVAQELLTERLATLTVAPDDEREQVRRVLQEAGLLTELGPELHRLADPTISLEEVRAALDRVEGKSLSEIVLEQRGPKG
ncbi:MAG: hypothetical protein HYR94_13735 [Chloroflexi bacterium]|nr:hypothetical protein [Chloroflexota bacterium]